MATRGVSQTQAVHAGEPRPNGTRSVVPPLVASTSYPFATLADAADVVHKRSDAHDYSRYSNPTVRQVEQKLAALEGAEDAALFGSGMAAITTTLLALLQSGDHVVLADQCYRPTEQFITQTLTRWGVGASRVPYDDADAIRDAAASARTRVLFVESPSNPHQRVADIETWAEIKRGVRGARLVVDATLATPHNQRPLTLGADLVVHSATKFLGGHNDVLAGVVCGRAGAVGVVRDLRAQLGGVCEPHAAWLLNRGLKTFGLRMERHNTSALAVARFLESHPAVARVWYTGLPSHPDHARAAEALVGGGGVVAFELRDAARVEAFCDAVRVFQIAASLGGAESLLHPPALFSYADLEPEARAARGMVDALIRLSVGLEDVADLIADLDQALGAYRGAR